MQQLKVILRKRLGDSSLSCYPTLFNWKLNLCLQQLYLTFIFGLLVSRKYGIKSIKGHCDSVFLKNLRNPVGMQEILLLALVFSRIMIAVDLSYTLMHNLNKASLFSISDVILQCS